MDLPFAGGRQLRRSSTWDADVDALAAGAPRPTYVASGAIDVAAAIVYVQDIVDIYALNLLTGALIWQATLLPSATAGTGSLTVVGSASGSSADAAGPAAQARWLVARVTVFSNQPGVVSDHHQLVGLIAVATLLTRVQVTNTQLYGIDTLQQAVAWNFSPTDGRSGCTLPVAPST
jgi:hypothetical protein